MKIVLALVLVACVAVQAAPAAKKVKGVCRRLAHYSFCPLNAEGKPDFKHCKGVKVCGSEKGKWEKVGDDDGEDGAAKKVKGACLRMAWYWFCPLNAKGKVDYKTCYRVKECGNAKGKWVKVGDDGPEHFEPIAGDHHHKHKKCKDGDDSDEDGDHKHKRRCKHGDESGDESGGESDGDDDDDDKDEDGDKKKKRKCKKKHGSDGEDSDGSGDSGSDSDHKHGCKKHGSDDSGDDSD